MVACVARNAVITFVFCLALVVQALTVFYAGWMVLRSHRRRRAWALLALGFSGMLAFRGMKESDFAGKPRASVLMDPLREDGTPMPVEERPASRTFSTGQSCRDVTVSIRRPNGSERERIWLSMNSEPLTVDRKGKVQAVV